MLIPLLFSLLAAQTPQFHESFSKTLECLEKAEAEQSAQFALSPEALLSVTLLYSPDQHHTFLRFHNNSDDTITGLDIEASVADKGVTGTRKERYRFADTRHLDEYFEHERYKCLPFSDCEFHAMTNLYDRQVSFRVVKADSQAGGFDKTTVAYQTLFDLAFEQCMTAMSEPDPAAEALKDMEAYKKNHP